MNFYSYLFQMFEIEIESERDRHLSLPETTGEYPGSPVTSYFSHPGRSGVHSDLFAARET